MESTAIKMINEYGADCHLLDNHWDYLLLAAMYGLHDLVKLLILKGLDVNK